MISGSKSEPCAMGGSEKQQKMMNLVRRPLSNQSTSVAAVNEVRSTVSKEVTQVVEGVTEGSSSVSSFGTLRENGKVSDVSDGKYSVSLEVGASVIRFIRGKEGSHKKIEEETRAKIILPSSRTEDYITIKGVSADCVTTAWDRVETIIHEAVRSPSLDYSHFVSLPLAIYPELMEKLEKFQNSILEKNDIADLGIEKSIFINPKTFHLTVLMLKLWNKDRVNAARDVLKSIYPSVMDALDNRPLLIRLKGLDCLRGSLAKARVLYAPVEEVGNEGRLLRACQVIIDAFVKAGLVLEKDAKHSLKLHATVMNAKHRKSKNRRRETDAFDAREIHKQYRNKDWGEYLIREAHLSQRFLYDESGYYHCCASIPFPTIPKA